MTFGEKIFELRKKMNHTDSSLRKIICIVYLRAGENAIPFFVKKRSGFTKKCVYFRSRTLSDTKDL